MTREPLSLKQQIEAVETAARRYLAMSEEAADQRSGEELEAISAALETAAETLKTLNFARETLG